MQRSSKPPSLAGSWLTCTTYEGSIEARYTSRGLTTGREAPVWMTLICRSAGTYFKRFSYFASFKLYHFQSEHLPDTKLKQPSRYRRSRLVVFIDKLEARTFKRDCPSLCALVRRNLSRDAGVRRRKTKAYPANDSLLHSLIVPLEIADTCPQIAQQLLQATSRAFHMRTDNVRFRT